MNEPMTRPVVSLSRPGGGWVMCCICFEYRQPTDLYIDWFGATWDLCLTGTCARQAGFGIPFIHPYDRKHP